MKSSKKKKVKKQTFAAAMKEADRIVDARAKEFYTQFDSKPKKKL